MNLFETEISYLSEHIKKNNIVIFYTPRSFEGNLKYLFLYFDKKFRKDKMISYYWLTTDIDVHHLLIENKLPTLLWSDTLKKPFYELLKCKVLIHDGFFHNGESSTLLYNILKHTKIINLWHGTPIKKIHLQLLPFLQENEFHMAAVHTSAINNEVFCYASSNHLKNFQDAFQSHIFAKTGYPRNDILFSKEPTKYELINVDTDLLGKIKNKKVAIYMPTWRREHNWIEKANIQKLVEKLTQLNYILVVNPHPFEYHIVEDYLKKINNIVIPKYKTDIYPILAHTDLLITDYSSIVFDYLLLNKPIMFYRPDDEAYVEEHGISDEQLLGLNFPVIYNVNDIIEKINVDEELLKRAKHFHNQIRTPNASAYTSLYILKLLKYNKFSNYSMYCFFKLKKVLGFL